MSDYLSELDDVFGEGSWRPDDTLRGQMAFFVIYDPDPDLLKRGIGQPAGNPSTEPVDEICGYESGVVLKIPLIRVKLVQLKDAPGPHWSVTLSANSEPDELPAFVRGDHWELRKAFKLACSKMRVQGEQARRLADWCDLADMVEGAFK